MRTVLLVSVSLLLSACVSANSGSRLGSLSLRTTPTRNVLTAAEIVASRVSDAYQAVTQLRPDFLRRRHPSFTMTQPMPSAVSVYLDELPFGGIESLRAIPLERVRIIRYLPPFDAELRFGGSHPAGAILVTTLKDR